MTERRPVCSSHFSHSAPFTLFGSLYYHQFSTSQPPINQPTSAPANIQYSTSNIQYPVSIQYRSKSNLNLQRAMPTQVPQKVPPEVPSSVPQDPRYSVPHPKSKISSRPHSSKTQPQFSFNPNLRVLQVNGNHLRKCHPRPRRLMSHCRRSTDG